MTQFPSQCIVIYFFGKMASRLPLCCWLLVHLNMCGKDMIKPISSANNVYNFNINSEMTKDLIKVLYCTYKIFQNVLLLQNFMYCYFGKRLNLTSPVSMVPHATACLVDETLHWWHVWKVLMLGLKWTMNGRPISHRADELIIEILWNFFLFW